MLEPEVHFGRIAKTPKGLLVKNEISTCSLKIEELDYRPSSSTWELFSQFISRNKKAVFFSTMDLPN